MHGMFFLCFLHRGSPMVVEAISKFSHKHKILVFTYIVTVPTKFAMKGWTI